MSGIRPGHLHDADATGSFAAALQTAGFINLGYVQDFNRKVAFCFPSAYPGYRHNQDQQGLAISRLMVRSFLLQGRSEEMKKYLHKIGVFY